MSFSRNEVDVALQVAAKTALDNTSGSTGKACALHAESLQNGADMVDIYKRWVADYDFDVAGESYMAPSAVAKVARDFLADASSPKVLDAGCGTGLAGEELLKLVDVNLSGCDISPDMMKHALGRGYKRVDVVNLKESMTMYNEGEFDVVMCVGTFVNGHVGPAPAMAEFVRLLKPGGLAVSTVRTDFFNEMGFADVLAELESEGHTVSSSCFQYLDGVVAELVTIRKRADN